ncbi:MAG: MBL fold metallo-hydrolase [Myxococcales bacterium]
MRLCVLGSGSLGNCVWVEAPGARILVDAGLSHRETLRRCRDAGLDLRDLTDICITHEHGDHCFGAAVIARKTGARVHATVGTFRALRDPPPAELCFPLPSGELVVGSLRIRAVPVPHDAVEPVAYVLEERGGDGRAIRAAIVTDLGFPTRPLAASLQDLDALVLEMNHDPRLVIEGPYPPSLKRRLLSDVGHLSNAQGAQLLRRVAHAGLRHVVLAHLSEQNNTESYARREAEAALQFRSGAASLVIAPQMRPLPPVEILSEGMRFARRPQQLALFG